MNPADAETRTPSRFAAIRWEGKAALLRVRRMALDLTSGPRLVRHRPAVANNAESTAAAFPVLLAESKTPLWSDPRLAERRLQLGKVQNLRRAVRAFHNLSLRANQTISFWKQVGRATKPRGFAPGREIREGCVIPTLGGGLCQLSNALHQVALDGGAEITERHAHSRRVPGSRAQEAGRDATVFWNYLDLRFSFAQPVRMEAFLTDSELVVRVFGPAPVSKAVRPLFRRMVLLDPAETAPSCASCEQDACFRAPDANENAAQAETRAFLLNERWPEWEVYLNETWQPDDFLALPINGTRWRLPRFAWCVKTEGKATVSAPVLALRQSLRLRLLARRHAPAPQVRAAQLEMAAQMACRLAQTVPYEAFHLCVAQAFLPALWQSGILGGRTFDVMMTGLPLTDLHAHLDVAFAAHPDRSLLHDFRAPASVVQAETDALACARRLITPHGEVAALFGDRTLLLPWVLPPAPLKGANATPKRRALAFSGPAIARKNAHAVREAAHLLDAEVILLYPPSGEHEGPDFWKGVRISRPAPGSDWRVSSGAACLVSPDVVCEKPRAALSALAAQIPVLATPACGLGYHPGVTLLPPNATGEEMAVLVSPFLLPAVG